MKPGARVLGIAESFRDEASTLAGAVVTANGSLEDLRFSSCTVGGLDATDSILDLWAQVGREDIGYCLINGVALARFNVVDLDAIAASIPVPVLALTYEESDGLVEHIRAAFPPDRAADRVALYRALPPRDRMQVGGRTVYVRVPESDGIDAEPVLAALDWNGNRPEPIRLARVAAQAGDRWRRRNRCG